MKKISVVGIVGIPARYGGFETLVENLVIHHTKKKIESGLYVYCQSSAYDNHPASYMSANLRWIPIAANGIGSIFFDSLSIISSLREGVDTVLILGVSGAPLIPAVRWITKTRFVINIDGIEWRREKWGRLARSYLKFAEAIAVRFADEVIVDNEGVRKYVEVEYGRDCPVIPYGGDHAIHDKANNEMDPSRSESEARPYFLALCRIEPENNVDLILEAFARVEEAELIFIGNWDASEYGKELTASYRDYANIEIRPPSYDAGDLFNVRSGSVGYIHGHSKGGTNPALVEMMHFGKPIIAFDCEFNRYTTSGLALYFTDVNTLIFEINSLLSQKRTNGPSLRAFAQKNYTWDKVASKYFELL